jgi:hypothetical protein
MAGKAKFKLRRRGDFDFSRAPIYRKTATLKKSQVKIAARRQEVVTMVNGIEETRNIARAGDHIVTGQHGERYVLKPAKFKALYELERSRPARYRAKTRVRALTLEENTEMMAPWGEKQRARKGGAVVQRVGRPADVYLIERRIFGETYALANPVPPKKSRRDRLIKDKP